MLLRICKELFTMRSGKREAGRISRWLPVNGCRQTAAGLVNQIIQACFLACGYQAIYNFSGIFDPPVFAGWDKVCHPRY